MIDPRDGTRDPRLSNPGGPGDDPVLGKRHGDPAGDPAARRGGGTMWAWLAGIAAAVFIIAIVYGFSNRGSDDVAFDRNGPAATTGSAATGTAPPAGSGASSVPGATGPASERSADPAPAPAAPAR